MKKHMTRYGLFGAVLLITTLILPISRSGADFSADMINTSPMGTINGKAYFKEGNFRQEMVMGGANQVTIFRKDKGLVWLLMPDQMMYMEMDGDGGQNMGPVDPDELEKMGKMEYLGKEKVNDYLCKKYRFTHNDPSFGTGTIWISEKLNFPVKMEMDGPSGHMVTEYRNISEKTVPDALFNIPSGYRKMAMPMMPGMQKQ